MEFEQPDFSHAFEDSGNLQSRSSTYELPDDAEVGLDGLTRRELNAILERKKGAINEDFTRDRYSIITEKYKE